MKRPSLSQAIKSVPTVNLLTSTQVDAPQATPASVKPAGAGLYSRRAAGRVMLSFRVSEQAERELKIMAIDVRKSLNAIVVEALNEYRERRGLPPLQV